MYLVRSRFIKFKYIHLEPNVQNVYDKQPRLRSKSLVCQNISRKLVMSNRVKAMVQWNRVTEIEKEKKNLVYQYYNSPCSQASGIVSDRILWDVE